MHSKEMAAAAMVRMDPSGPDFRPYAVKSKVKRNGVDVFYFVTDNEFFGADRLRTRDRFRPPLTAE